jgi:hypothetical protein
MTYTLLLDSNNGLITRATIAFAIASALSNPGPAIRYRIRSDPEFRITDGSDS